MQNRLLKLMLMVGFIPFYAANAQPDTEIENLFDGEVQESVQKKLKNNNGKAVVIHPELDGQYVLKPPVQEQHLQIQFQVPQVQQHLFQQHQVHGPYGMHTGMNGTFYNNPPKPPQLRPLNPQNLTELTKFSIGPAAENNINQNPSGFGGDLPSSQVFALSTEGSKDSTKYMSILHALSSSGSNNLKY